MTQMRSYLQLAFFLSLGAIIVAACSQPDPLDGLAEGETGRVVRIIDGDALVLDTGLTVRLVGLEAPAPQRRNRIGQPYAEQSARLLEDLVMGRQVRLLYPGITRDRYDRALAYVRTEDQLGPDLWLNREMLRQGGARARFYPDTSALGELLLQDEAEARENRRGLWALTDYAILAARDIPVDARGFYIISGVPDQTRPPDNSLRDLRCVRTLKGAALTLGITPAAAKFCAPTPAGSPFELRGYIFEGRMEITHTLNTAPLTRMKDHDASTRTP